MTVIHTVTGTTTPEQLGTTLMHEHLMIGYPGWEAHTSRARSRPGARCSRAASTRSRS